MIYTRYPPMVFGPRGTFIKQVGRMGEGPGEFRRPTGMAAVGDSVAIYDEAGRIELFDPDLAWVRSIRAPQLRVGDVLAVDWPRAVLINGFSRSPDLAGWALHLADLSGSQAVLQKSLGAERGTLLPSSSRRDFMRQVSPASPAGFWVMNRTGEYAFSRWSGDGELEGRFLRDSETFPRGFDGLPGGPEHAPSPELVDLQQASDSLLWVVGRVPHPEWREAWRDVGLGRLPQDPTPIPASSFPRVYDLYRSVIEVIDPMSPSVVWRERSASYVVALLPGPRMVVYSETEIGVPVLEVSEIRLVDAR